MKTIAKAAVARIICGLFLAAAFLVYFNLQLIGSATKPAPAVFATETGFTITSDWELLDSGDNHGGFVGDGETFFIYRVSAETLAQVLSLNPPWSTAWRNGPVEHEIGFHASFGTDGVGYGSSNGGPNKYMGDPKLKSLLSSGQIRYDAKERCCDSIRWHNGHLLVIDPINSTVWLSIWDF